MFTTAKRAILANDVSNRIVTGALRAGIGPHSGAARRLRDVHRLGPVKARLPDGTHLRLFSDREWITSRVFWQGWDGYEPETARFFWRRAARAAYVVDVGANLGYYTLLAALANRSARVVALEPVPDILRRLHRNLELNRVTNVEVIAAAATARSGAVGVRMRADGYDDRGVVEAYSDESRDGDDWRTETVAAVAVDDLGLDGLDLVKIDIEGGELDALEGMAGTIERHRPVIVCELCSDENCAAVEGVFGPRDYAFWWITGAGLLPVDGPLRRPWPWRNCVLSPRERSDSIARDGQRLASTGEGAGPGE